GDALAAGLAGSFALGQGQFCTKPGLVFVPEASMLEAALPDHVGDSTQPMLNDSILSSFEHGIAELEGIPGVDHVAGTSAVVDGAPQPRVVAVDIATLEAHSERLLEEVFGPVTVLVRCDDQARVRAALERLDGALTGTIHAEPGDDVDQLTRVLSARVGRVLFDGWPTGVAVTWSQHHGGPYPATTSVHTSVGATAVRRFQRPVAYQDAPASVLPAALRDDNPLSIPLRVDGALVLPHLG
ncbi:MAG: aldehyde dehydrogenase (NADP(+)), partial [Demequina sp.]